MDLLIGCRVEGYTSDIGAVCMKDGIVISLMESGVVLLGDDGDIFKVDWETFCGCATMTKADRKIIAQISELSLARKKYFLEQSMRFQILDFDEELDSKENTNA